VVIERTLISGFSLHIFCTEGEYQGPSEYTCGVLGRFANTVYHDALMSQK
jgi:hypothetical protein